MRNRLPTGKPPSQRPNRQGPPNRFAAFHEAGHAVVDVLLGFDLKRVDLTQRDIGHAYANGTTDCGDIRNEEFLGKGKAAVMPLLIGNMAGIAAESKVNPKVWMQAAGTMDIDTAKRFAVAAICDYTVEGNIARFDEHQIRSRQREIDGLIHEALEEAIRMVDENLDAITRVAEQLLRRGKLMGSEVAAIVNACRKREDE